MRGIKPAIFIASLIAIILLLIIYPRQVLLFIAYGLTIAYIFWGIYHIIILAAGVKRPVNPGTRPKTYPRISLIIPARDEPILPRTIEVCLNNVEYPLDRKEIIVVTEDPIGERIATWYAQVYPGRVLPLIRREYFPTKPKRVK